MRRVATAARHGRPSSPTAPTWCAFASRSRTARRPSSRSWLPPPPRACTSRARSSAPRPTRWRSTGSCRAARSSRRSWSTTTTSRARCWRGGHLTLLGEHFLTTITVGSVTLDVSEPEPETAPEPEPVAQLRVGVRAPAVLLRRRLRRLRRRLSARARYSSPRRLVLVRRPCRPCRPAPRTPSADGSATLSSAASSSARRLRERLAIRRRQRPHAVHLEAHRIDEVAAAFHGEVEVRAGDAPRLTDEADELASLDVLAGVQPGSEAREMAVRRREVAGVLDLHHVPARSAVAGAVHGARRAREDGRARRSRRSRCRCAASPRAAPDACASG